MNFTDFLTSHGKKVNKNAFIHLVQVSRVDGKIAKDEFELLHRQGKKFGLTDPEIDRILESEKEHHYHPPYSLEEKFDHLFNIAEMIAADDKINESEKKAIRRFAIESGFRYDSIESIIDFMIRGVKENVDEEKLFREFKKLILK